MDQEEDSWLTYLVDSLPAPEKTRMTQRFAEEYERYRGKSAAPAPGRARRARTRVANARGGQAPGSQAACRPLGGGLTDIGSSP